MQKQLFAAVVAISLLWSAFAFSQPTSIDRFGWNDRYLNYNSTGSYIVGFDLQQIHSDLAIDYRSAIDFLVQYQLNKFRIWLYTPWYGTDQGGENILFPWRIEDSGGARKFDIEQWDPNFWSRLRDVISYARDRGIVVEVSLFSIQESIDYFKDDDGQEYAFRASENIQGFGQLGPDGDFYPEFFDLSYAEGGIKIFDYQIALVDKAIDELESFDNVYFELVNEAPGPTAHLGDSLYLDWASTISTHIKARTDRLITVHAHGYADPANVNNGDISFQEIQNYIASVAAIPSIDGLNFHWRADQASEISEYLGPQQARRLVMSNNEGVLYFRVDTSTTPRSSSRSTTRLFRELRQGWGHLLSGGYYLAYQGAVELFGDEVSAEMAEAMQSMRTIVESIPEWQQLRPVKDDGTEFDADIQSGPGADRQLMADPGNAYLLYFSGNKNESPVVLDLSAGTYEYVWYDVRRNDAVLATGTVEGADGAVILSPQSNAWNDSAGVALTVIRQGSTGLPSPSIDPDGGSYATAVTVTISAGSDATIHYTTDGSRADNNSPRYTNAFVLEQSATVRAIARQDGFADSAEASATFTVTPGGGGSDPSEYQQASDGLVVIELENPANSTSASGHRWDEITRSGASGTAVQALPNDGANINSNFENSSPRLDYAVNFRRSGIHHVWIRGLGTASADDSLHVGLNGTGVSTADRISNFGGSWRWSSDTMDSAKAQIDIPSPGLHVINLWMREDGMIADKLVLHPSDSYKPSGTGP